ncbi:ead/Ea22-like family protein [Klebsiella pneumoniae]|uniref:ead/Ea22-like family protein n=1 Tax=Klebsiella pneumoniae TaxID=573 RepID=UPI00115EA921|nr:ead/Ea22-like family protein [Klebsiella pneumoniae]
MTTDITELAQSLKAAAIDAKELAIIARYSKGRAAAEKFYAMANPNNVIALVEALEKAQQRIAELESRTVTAAAAAVLAERKRQVAAEGWTPGHDDEYEHGELADAAGCYALSSELFDCAGEPPRPWPWPDEWWKPTNRRRDLVKAGALILAEIERLDRASGIKVEAE